MTSETRSCCEKRTMPKDFTASLLPSALDSLVARSTCQNEKILLCDNGDPLHSEGSVRVSGRLDEKAGEGRKLAFQENQAMPQSPTENTRLATWRTCAEKQLCSQKCSFGPADTLCQSLFALEEACICLLYTSPSPRDRG